MRSSIAKRGLILRLKKSGSDAMKVLHAKILFHLVIFLPTLLCTQFIQFCFVNCTNYVNGRKKAFVRRSITATKHHVLYVLFSVHMRHELIKFVLCCIKTHCGISQRLLTLSLHSTIKCVFFYRCLEHRSCHGIFRRMHAVCAMKWPRSVRR